MSENRKIRKVFKSKPTIEGAGVHLRRVFGNSEVPLFDPFLLLDDFRNTDPHQYIKGFPWHPHRGRNCRLHLKNIKTARSSNTAVVNIDKV